MAAAAVPPINPHRPLVALGDMEGKSAGELSVRSKSGDSLHIRVLQEQIRQDSHRRVRWIFSEAEETFQIELKHFRSGLRRIYVNREMVASSSDTEGKSHFALISRNGAHKHDGTVLVTKEKGVDTLYQLLIDNQPIQLVKSDEEAIETPRSPTPRSPSSTISSGDAPSATGSPLGSARKAIVRSMSFGRRADSAAKKAAAEMLACFHIVQLDKDDGPVGITVANSDAVMLDGRRRTLGVQVLSLEESGLAMKKGLRVGDIIMAVNDKRVNEHREAVEAVDADKQIELRVWGMRPTLTKMLWKGQGVVGITLVNNEFGPGVTVSSVTPDGQAMRLGLRAGDIILAINNTIVKDHSHAVQLIDEAPKEMSVNFVSSEDDARPDILRQMEA